MKTTRADFDLLRCVSSKRIGTMKSVIRQLFCFSITTLVILTLFVGCGSPKPSISVVKKLVKEKLDKHVPRSYTAPERAVRWGTRNLQITSIEIVEWGKFNENRKYWPAKVKVVGSVEAEYQTGFASTTWTLKKFDKIDEFLFYKDDYGKWQIGTR